MLIAQIEINKIKLLLGFTLILLISCTSLLAQPKMMFGDTTRRGVPFSKDPHVIHFKGKYFMYYSIPPHKNKEHPVKGWGIGIAKSTDLINWNSIGEIPPKAVYEKKGLCAPCALVIEDTIHLFYQSYSYGKNDAICHAKSIDGINFIRNRTNPIFHPTGDWNCGRAIDAEVIKFKDQYLLYFATRDPEMKIQKLGVAVTNLNTNFKRDEWKLLANRSILEPELPWEQDCVEGASVIVRNNLLYMFYAGAYNNRPQQIGLAVSKNGIDWGRTSDKPFLPNGNENEWNSSESGHPHIFSDFDGKTYLFFQGNNNNGKTWLISNVEVKWNGDEPYLKAN